MSLRIVFMGTPDFAVPSLQILVENGYDVVGVITSTDKMGGRGKKTLIESAVKKYAVAQNLKILQPPRLKNKEFVESLRALKADLQIVVAFRMLPEVVWNMPTIGTINLHGSILPKYRGAAPINWAVINGEKETGVTTFFLKHEIDTGDILEVATTPIDENETAGDVYNRLMHIGADSVLTSVKKIESGNYKLQPQKNEKATKAPKIFSETCEIDFHQTTEKVHNFIRGMSPYPTAWTSLNGLKLKIFRTLKEVVSHKKPPNMILTDDRSFIKFATTDGFVEVLELQLEGKKRMKTKDFLNGYSFWKE